LARGLKALAVAMEPSLKIMIVAESPTRAAVLEEGLREAGLTRIVQIGGTTDLLAQIGTVDPDAILIDLERAGRGALDQVFQVSRATKRPIAMFVGQSGSCSIQASVEAGVSAYIVDGLKKERVKPILDLCISRFHVFSRLQAELEETRTALEGRKVIDRAKAILMKAKNLSEDAAYALLRKAAMNEHKRIAEVAKSVITAAELLK
jgi:response regulator NasT